MSIATTIGLAVASDGRLHRQLVDVGVEVLFVLPAVVVEALAEVALVVEQADADERDAQVAGALDVVAGEHAEAAGVDRQRLVQAELGREIGDGLGRSTPACRAPQVRSASRYSQHGGGRRS